MEEKDYVQELSVPIFQSKGWLKFVGVMSIIYGIITCFTLIGIIIAWLPIWMGIMLFRAGSSIELAQSNGDKEQFIRSLSSLKTYFIIQGVLVLIGLIVMVIALIVTGGSMFALFSQFG
ncbi:MAG: DUF5362 domain-containing protein [candidate division Zixibacteria bacterium]|nr:DUF5362 domain-containing protein [Candidatus Tariuqbacter arcticus]